eukprot:s1_g281.t1
MAADARAALMTLVGDQDVRLSYGGRRQDRYGRLLAHLHLPDGRWVQGAMISQGMARVYSFSDNRACVRELLALETQARETQNAIWSHPYYSILKAPQQEQLLSHIDSFQLVEGTVQSAALVRGRLYLNFGDDWREDFTVTVAPSNVRHFSQDVEAYRGARIRVRGWIKSYNGPEIVVTHPEQIERRAKAPLFLILGVALSGCSFVLEGASSPASTPQEVVAGNQISAHDRILQTYGGAYHDPALHSYVRSVIGRLKQHPDLSTRTYALTILNSPLANAMALSDGRIYLTRGMLALLNDEAELAAVLAHEMAHVSAGHIASRRDIADDIALLDGLVDDLVGWEGRVGLLSRSGLLAGYSRLQENDADRLAVTYLETAGYDPLAVSDVLAVMNAYTKYRATQIDAALWVSTAGWLANHPDTEDRARQTAERAYVLRLSDQPKQRGRPRYLEAIDGLLYGMPAERGFVRGNRFVHTVEDFRFQVPDGFRLYNAGDVVWALGPDKVIVKLDQVSVAEETDPLTYLTTDWAGALALRDMQRLDINGLPGASAWMRFQGLNTFAAVILPRPGSAYRFLIGVPPQLGDRHNGDIHSIISSFGLVRDQDTKVGLLRIRVVQTAHGERMEDVAMRMRMDSERSAEFYLINDRRPGDLVAAGTWLKLIEERLVR